jgi:CheY-like chemotaxis protein
MVASTNLETSESQGGAKPLVICVDDEPRVLAALQRILRREPYETIATENPSRVLELVGRRPVSLVVADQRMPTMSGTHLLRMVRRESPATQGLILSGYSSVDEIAPAINDGTVGCFIPKPWDDADFRRAIRQLLCLNVAASRSPAGKKRRKAVRRAVPSHRRPILRVDCARKATPEILEEVSAFLSRPEHSLCGAALVLQNLGLLGDSISRFLTAVILKLARSSTPVALVEKSGTANDCLQLFGSNVPFLAYRSEADLPEPKRVLFVGTVGSSPMLLRQIESAGHACRTAATPSQAIRQMIPTSFDLVLLGRIFADPKGVDLARRVMKRLLDVPVFALPEAPPILYILDTIRKCKRVADPD